MSNKLVQLRQFIVEHYNLDELRTLCFDLGLSYEELSEGGISAKVRELLLWLGREQKLDKLLTKVEHDRELVFHEAGFRTDPATLDLLYAALPAFAALHNLPDRPQGQQILLEKVKTFWIEGVLEKSLHGAALIELGKEVCPEAVDYPWEMVVQPLDTEPYILPLNKHIANVYDEANGSLLILGAPGAGKTTMLLELARTAIARAQQDSRLPVPVMFNLSSWQKEQPFHEWLVAELNGKYLIPKKIGRNWVAKDKLLLLLDGLDEVAHERRLACLEVINQFRQEQLAGVVECSRVEEYEAINEKLKLNSAIFLRPLTREQVDVYLAAGGEKLEAMRTIVKTDKELAELIRSPLMLNIMILAYQDTSIAELEKMDRESDGRSHLFFLYTRRMLFHRGRVTAYSSSELLTNLVTLARGMLAHSQSIFLVERLQPSWLSSSLQRHLFVLTSRLLGGLSIGLIGGLVLSVWSGVISIPFEYFSSISTLTEALGAAKAIVLGILVAATFPGLKLGLVLGLAMGFAEVIHYEVKSVKWKRAPQAFWLPIFQSTVLTGLKAGGIFSLTGLTLAILRHLVVPWGLYLTGALWLGSIIGLMFGLLFGLEVGLVDSILRHWRKQGINKRPITRKHMLLIAIGMGFSGLISGVVVPLIPLPVYIAFGGLDEARSVLMSIFSAVPAILGPVAGLIAGVLLLFYRPYVAGINVQAEEVAQSNVNQSLLDVLKKGMLSGLLVGVLISLTLLLSLGALFFYLLTVEQPAPL